MSMSARDLKDWILTIHDDTAVGIDDGGLTLTTEDGSAYLEIGGISVEGEEEQEA